MKFQSGKTYSARSIGDHEIIISVTIEKRTAKTVTVNMYGNQKTFRIAEYEGIEYIKPWGNYSMAPMIFAEN